MKITAVDVTITEGQGPVYRWRDGIPGGDGNTHAAFREQPGTTCADARAASDNKRNVLDRGVVGLGHWIHAVSRGNVCRPAPL